MLVETNFFTSTFGFISIVFFLSSLLFQIFRLRVPEGEELVMEVRLIGGFYLGFPRVLLHFLKPIIYGTLEFFLLIPRARARPDYQLLWLFS